MKISLVIPCIPSHFLNLKEKLDVVLNGTRIPDEIVISLSESKYVPEKYIKEMKNDFSEKVDSFVVLEHDRKLTHGPNRQAGSEVASGELLIYQDADDYSHPQRLEIIEYFYENHDIVHLNHGWIPTAIEFDDVDKTKVSYIKPEDIYNRYFPNDRFIDCISIVKCYGCEFVCTHAGNTSILKKVLEKVRWKDWNELRGPAEDYEFCMEVAYNFKKSMIIDVPLLHYTNPAFQNLTLSDLGYEK